MGVCVPNFRSVSFFVRPGAVTQIRKLINTLIHVNLRISSTGCSPHVDFENWGGMSMNDLRVIYCTRLLIHKTKTHFHKEATSQTSLILGCWFRILRQLLLITSKLCCQIYVFFCEIYMFHTKTLIVFKLFFFIMKGEWNC